MSQLFNNGTPLDITPYLTTLVEKNGADIFLHTGARPTLSGPFGFVAMGEPLENGQTLSLLQSMLPDHKMAEFSGGRSGFFFSIGSFARFRSNAARQRLNRRGATWCLHRRDWLPGCCAAG